MTFASNDTKYFGIPKGRPFSVAAAGTFGSGTLSVKYASEGNWVTYASGDGGAFTAADERVFENVGDLDQVQLVLAGATAPDLDVICNAVK